MEVLSGSRWLTSYRGAKKKDQPVCFSSSKLNPLRVMRRHVAEIHMLYWTDVFSGAGQDKREGIGERNQRQEPEPQELAWGLS